ncbi:hypothetical protein [Microbacterium sp. MPKO10]|uniref:PheS-related mystery ligase SrmL n=1 Tax=Microbacterium sp. MPKO10 TaxID=2989818 RepID=UPI002235BEF4|nr:hypothetical protein [Microbacterium sp. MPKO10]MCW4459201.1 hypothetical protein [Microbacterium sp. MPKO10]
MTSDYLTPAQLHDALNVRDLSNPAHGQHAMQLILADVVTALTKMWHVPAREHRTSPLTSVDDNYDRLGYSPDAVTRDRRYSRYVSPTVMLRSHTTAAMPQILADLARAERARTLSAADRDSLHVVPGLVYRRDSIDRTHVGEPHQVDLWRIARRTPLGADDLQRLAATVVEAVLPGATWRAVPSPHPYTVAGLQVDVLSEGEWLELAECGIADPAVLQRRQLNPGRWTGLALGMGLDRALMLRKGISDIRILRSDDPRVAEQMRDLAPWRPVSTLPPIRRDLSVVVGEGSDEETIGDAVRSALGSSVDALESVELLSWTAYASLPAAARERLALQPDQANALLRITLRPLSETMTDAEANAIRDTVYRAVHVGPVLELIGAP